MAVLVRRALRMNADRVIVGEVLGDEVIPMLNAMSQGRSGSMCTIHADSSAGVFRRLRVVRGASDRAPSSRSNDAAGGGSGSLRRVPRCGRSTWERSFRRMAMGDGTSEPHSVGCRQCSVRCVAEGSSRRSARSSTPTGCRSCRTRSSGPGETGTQCRVHLSGPRLSTN